MAGRNNAGIQNGFQSVGENRKNAKAFESYSTKALCRLGKPAVCTASKEWLTKISPDGR
jgi:hypothetical protein